MTLENLIDDVYNRIKFDKDSLEKNELGRIKVDSFNLSDFWSQFGVAVQALNNEVTKVGFMCGKKPFPTDAEVGSMMQDLLQYYTIMKDLYLVLPEEVGASLFKAVTSGVTDIMVSLLNFVNSLRCLSEKGAKERLTLTGSFWDACNAIDSIPKDNLQATLKVLESGVDLASDAQMELETVSTFAAINEVNNKFHGFQKVSIIAKESNSAHKPENIFLSPSTESNDEFHEESSEVNKTLQKSKASKFILDKSGHDNCKKEHKVDHVLASDLIENSDEYYKEFKKVKDQSTEDSYFSHHTSEGLLSQFIVLDEVHEDDVKNSDDFDSLSVTSSSLNGDSVVLENEDELDLNMGTGISKTEEIKIDSETATSEMNFVTLPTPACQLPSDVEASVDPGYKKQGYLLFKVPEKRLSGSVRRKRKKYIEEVSENLVKAFKLNISMENMEAMAINVPKRFIENCDSFNMNKLKDSICEHNPTLDVQKWVIYAHWLGDSRHLVVLLLVDQKSLQQLNALDCKINLSEDIKIGIKKFVPFNRNKQMTSGDSRNYRPTSSLKRDSKTISTKNKHSNYPSTSIKKNVISFANQTATFTRDTPSMILNSNKPSFHKKTFTRATSVFIPDSNRPLYDPLERNKISMLRPDIRQINEISSTKSNKNYIGQNRGGIRCDRVHPEANQGYYGPNSLLRDDYCSVKANQSYYGPNSLLRHDYCSVKANQSYYGPNSLLRDDYCSVRSDFSRQDYSLDPFPKIKLNKSVSDNVSHRKRKTFSWCQGGNYNSMEQSESEHLRNRSSFLGHLKSSEQSGLDREEGCTSRGPSLRGFLSRGDSLINHHQGSTKKPRHQNVTDFYPRINDFNY